VSGSHGRWVPVVLWMAAVFSVSSLPSSRLGRLVRTPDWITHPLEYAVGGALVCRALVSGPGRAPSVRATVAAALLTTAYGVTDEYHQSFVPGRSADPADVAKDFAGAATAALLYRRWTIGAAGTLSEERPR
jgi:VanZ family protein